MSQNNALARSFMCLSFATGMLLIAVQWQELAARPTAPAAASAPILTFGQPVSATTVQQVAPPPPVANPALNSRLVVSLSDRRVYLYRGESLRASYEIAVGKTGWETPTGSFSVISKQQDPVWQHPFTGELVPPGADNPLGSRWIGFWTDGAHQIGFHGTNEEDLIGQAVSHGCLRMREADVQALYQQVAIGTVVDVKP